MSRNINLYILIMFAATYLVRALPVTLIRGKIRSPFLQSFLYYMPYVTLAVMTFPAIIESTQTPVSGLMALAAGILAAWFGASLLQVASLCCVVVLLAECILV
ncbi:MAG: AzlD domain-containing protein [Lachnospiraceae bacterium]|nr:AzlD domain-containing protein [Lachnospiraceae bacterium]